MGGPFASCLLRRGVRTLQAHEAGQQRVETSDLDVVSTVAFDPGRVAAGRDLLEEVRRRLSPEERQIADLRAQERSWPEVAAELGGTPEARRKQLDRALNRVAQELGLAEDSDAAL